MASVATHAVEDSTCEDSTCEDSTCDGVSLGSAGVSDDVSGAAVVGRFAVDSVAAEVAGAD